MNERIKQLAEQAGFLNKDEESIEYFAELIVRECIQEMTLWERIDLAIRGIKERFGVEE
jgi:hypothetical protein